MPSLTSASRERFNHHVSDDALVDYDDIRRIIRGQRFRRGTVCQLVFFVALILLFMFMFYGGRNIEEEYYATNAVETLLTQTPLFPVDPSTVTPTTTADSVDPGSRNPYFAWTYNNVGQENPDMYSYLKGVLVPLLFQTDADRREALRLATSSTPGSLGIVGAIQNAFGGSVETIGVMRFRAKHMSPSSCANIDATLYQNDPQAVAYYQGKCFGDWSAGSSATNWSTLSTGSETSFAWSYSTAGCENYYSWATEATGLLNTYACGGFIVDVPFSASRDAVWALMDEMKNERFMNSMSLRYFQVDFFLYRPPAKVFVRVNLFTEVTTGGGFSTNVDIYPFSVSSQNGGWMFYAVVILVCYIVYAAFLAANFALHLADARKEGLRLKEALKFFIRPWNLLEAANILCFLVWFGFYCSWWRWSHAQEGSAFQSRQGRALLREYPMHLSLVARLYWVCSYLNALNVFFLLLKLLRFLRTWPRVNALERTIVVSFKSLLSISLLLVLYVVAYTIAGTMLYGQRLESFRNLTVAMGTLFRVLIGEFDYDQMFQTHRNVAHFIFFWTYIIFGLFVLLNFCIAVLIQNFQQEFVRRRQLPILKAWRRHFQDLAFSFDDHHGRSVLRFISGTLKKYRYLREMEKIVDHAHEIATNEKSRVSQEYLSMPTCDLLAIKDAQGSQGTNDDADAMSKVTRLFQNVKAISESIVKGAAGGDEEVMPIGSKVKLSFRQLVTARFGVLQDTVSSNASVTLKSGSEDSAPSEQSREVELSAREMAEIWAGIREEYVSTADALEDESNQRVSEVVHSSVAQTIALVISPYFEKLWSREAKSAVRDNGWPSGSPEAICPIHTRLQFDSVLKAFDVVSTEIDDLTKLLRESEANRRKETTA